MESVTRSLPLIRDWQSVPGGAFPPAAPGLPRFGAAESCWRKTRRPLAFALAVSVSIVGFFQVGQADAATYTWDANGAASGVTDGTGIWNTTAGNTVWWDGLADSVWSNAGPNDAIFGNGNGAAGTVNIGSAITVGNLTFHPASSGNYALTAANNSNTLTLSGATPTITTNAGATINARIVSASGFVKEGLGTLTLRGSTAGGTLNAIGGTITVNAGALVLGGSLGLGGGFQGNLTVANFGRFYEAQGIALYNSNGQITVGADAYAELRSDEFGALAGSGRVTLANDIALRSGTQNFTGVISGPGRIFIYSGIGAHQTLSGANLYTGETLIQSGTGNSLTLNHVNALQSSTLSGEFSPTKLVFGLAGTNTYNVGALGGSGSISLGSNTLSVGARNQGALSDAVISGSGGLTKLGTNSQTLRGANTYTGATTIGGGAIELTGSGTLSGSSPIIFSGTGEFRILGGNKTVGTVNRTAGNATISSTWGGSNTSFTVTSLLARTAGATANFVTTGGTNGTTNKIVLTGATLDAFIDHGSFFGGDNFAWNDASGYVRAMRYSGPADAGAVTSTGTTSLASATHQQITGAVTAQTDATFTTLKIAGAHAFTLAAAQTVTVDGILKTGTNASLSGGTGIRASAGQDLVVRTNALADAFTINTPILANGGNALVKAGVGSLTFGALAVNTYTGGTFINEGTLIVLQDSNLGSTAAVNNVVLNGGTLQPSASFALHANHGIDIGPAGGTLYGVGFGVTLGSANMLSGSGPLAITGDPTTIPVLTSSATQDYTGRMTIGVSSFFRAQIALGVDNLTNPFGTGDITVVTGAGSAIFVNRPGSVWNNRFFLSGNGEGSRGVLRTQQGGTFHGDIILTANAGISSDGTGTTTTLNGNISGAFALTLGGLTGANATNKYLLTGNNVHSSTTIGLGITNIDHDIALGAYNGTVTLHGNATLQAGADGIILNPDRSIALTGGVSGRHYIDVQAHDMTIQGVITGAATETLVIRGSGNLRLPGANTYSGPTLIEGGTVNVSMLGNAGVPGSFGQGPGGGVAPTVIVSGATIESDADHPVSTDVHLVVGGDSGNRATIASNAALPENTVTFSNPAEIGYGGVGPREVVFAGTNRVTFVSRIGDGSPTEPTTVIVEGGELTLGVNTHSGGTRVNGSGRLVATDDGNFGSTATENHITLDNGGTLAPAANIDLNPHHGLDVGPGGGTVDSDGFSLTLPSANMLSGSGLLTVRGNSGPDPTLISKAAQDYTGRMNVGVVGENTRIGLGADNVMNPFGTGTIVVRNGSSVDLDRPGAVLSNPFEIAGNGANDRGAIRAQRGGTLNREILLQGDASIRSDGTDTTTVLNGDISGPYALTVGGGPGADADNVYRLRGNNTHAETIADRGITDIDHDRALGAANARLTLRLDATLRAGADGIVLNPDRTIALTGGASGSRTIDVQNHDMTIMGTITGGVSETLVIRGSGRLRLLAANPYPGKTTIAEGTVSTDNVNVSATANQGLGTNTDVDLGVAATSSGVFLYTGPAGTLAKNINARGNGSDTIQNSGSGPLALSGTVTKTGTTLTLRGGANGITVSGVITGNTGLPNSDLIIDGGTTTLTNANTYNGPTFIRNSATLNANSANALPTANGRTAVTFDGTATSVLALGVDQAVASLTSAGAATVNLNAQTLTIGAASGSTIFAGTIDGAGGALVKNAASTQVLTGANTFSGATMISGGTLEAGAAASLGATASVAVNTGGTLLLSGSGDRINDGATVTLAGGTFDTAGLSETVGALTLSASSIIDLATGNGTLQFGDSHVPGWTGTLSIYNWTSGSDHLFFGTVDHPWNLTDGGLTTSQLAQIAFFSGAGSGFLGTGGFLAGGFGEIAPVPEPSGVFAGLALFGLAGWRERRKSQARRRESRCAA